MLMQYAWVMTPAKFTTPKGKMIEVDKNKPKDVMVPIDIAREVIRVGAAVGLCPAVRAAGGAARQLPDPDAARARPKDKWTDQQILYINQLHLFTVMTLTGKVDLVEKDGDKQVVLENSKPIKTETCTETERKRIQGRSRPTSTPPPPAAEAAEARPGGHAARSRPAAAFARPDAR